MGGRRDRNQEPGRLPPGGSLTGTCRTRGPGFSRKAEGKRSADIKGQRKTNSSLETASVYSCEDGEEDGEMSCRQGYGEALSDLRAGGSLSRNLLVLVQEKIVQSSY